MMNRRKFIKVTTVAVASAPLASVGIPSVGEVTKTKVLLKNNITNPVGNIEGGYVVTKEISELIEKKLFENDPIRRIANDTD